MLRGVVIQVLESGLAYVQKENSTERIGFTFGKIRDYRGQTARELGLHVGSKIHFTLKPDMTVKEVELVD